MKKTNKNIFILIIVILFILSSCESDSSDDSIAMIDDIPITEYEFTMRYNFNPHLAQYHNTTEAKKILLSALIAEKLLSKESFRSAKISNDIRNRIEQHKKEAIIERFRQDNIENQIEVSDPELKKEFLKTLNEVDIKFIAFNSLKIAKQIKLKITEGISFETVVREYMDLQGWNNQAIPEKTVKWSTESYDLEEIIFALGSGEISNPVQINGDYYLIKSENIRVNQHQNSTDYLNKIPALRDRIIKQKVKNKYIEFYESNIRPILGNVDWKKLNDAFEIITKEVSFHQKQQQSHPFSNEEALSDEIYLSYEAKQSQLRNMTIVQFPDQTTWDLEELMYNLKYGPYSFNYKNRALFKKSFRQNVLLALEFESIYQLALQADYQNNEHVINDTNIWETHYKANDYRHNLLKEAESNIILPDSTENISTNQLTELQRLRLDYFDKYLCSLLEKYSVKINLKKYETIELNKSDMVVMKTHYAHRLVMPLTEPIDGLPQWRNLIQKIFKESGIT